MDALGHDTPLLTDLAVLRPLYEEALERGWFVRRLSSVVHTPPRAPGKPRLELRTLGGFAATLDGQPLELPLTKAQELLVWLALKGPSSRADLVSALWEGSREQKHAEYCRVALRRLRAALSTCERLERDPLPYEGGVYRLSDELEVVCDVNAATPKASSSAFLPQMNSEWVLELRGRLERASLALN